MAMKPETATAFVFSAQGTQWAGMGRDLLASDAAFREVVERCDASIRRHFDWSLRRELEAAPERYRLHRDPQMVQPALTSLQIALAAALVRDGVRPAAVGSLSMGEAAAACCAGALDLDGAIDLACSTARLADTELRPGLMAFLHASWEESAALIAPVADRVAIAVELGRRLTVVSGEEKAVRQVLAAAAGLGILGGPLPLAQAYHSPDVAPLAAGFKRRLAGLRPHAGAIGSYSSVTASIPAELTADHWWRVCSEPARFYSLALAMIRDGYRDFVEIGPHPMLARTIQEAAAALGETVAVRAVMERGGGVRVAA
jgi:acyl transferase domain-containing protein